MSITNVLIMQTLIHKSKPDPIRNIKKIVNNCVELYNVSEQYQRNVGKTYKNIPNLTLFLWENGRQRGYNPTVTYLGAGTGGIRLR